MYKSINRLTGAICLLLAISSVSCKKWLDVQPEDRFIENQVFSSESSINQTLNGLYIRMADAPLYGSYLSMNTVDILAQLHNIGTQHSLRKVWEYAYTDGTVQSIFSNMWTSAYTTIANANEFLSNL